MKLKANFNRSAPYFSKVDLEERRQTFKFFGQRLPGPMLVGFLIQRETSGSRFGLPNLSQRVGPGASFINETGHPKSTMQLSAARVSKCQLNLPIYQMV
jgi:hypothetical protein